MRIDRIISQRGEYSRKMANKMVRRSRVAIDGVLCVNPKTQFPENANVTIDGYELPKKVRVYVYHKPAGMLSATDDPLGRSCVGDVLPVRHHLVGRLDMDTRGLLLLSMDGSLTQGLLHPKRAVEREYCAWVEGLPEDSFVERLKEGVETSLGLAQAKVLSIEGNCVRLVVTEGRNRIVRRMLHNAGHSVLDLMRVRFGPVMLGELDEGMMRPLDAEEEQILDAFLQNRSGYSKSKKSNDTK
jgi:23S rRNA pseudouridine2605 synthase